MGWPEKIVLLQKETKEIELKCKQELEDQDGASVREIQQRYEKYKRLPKTLRNRIKTMKEQKQNEENHRINKVDNRIRFHNIVKHEKSFTPVSSDVYWHVYIEFTTKKDMVG